MIRNSELRITKQEIEQRLSHFKKVCQDFKMKLTHQRLEIFREVAQTGDHPDAESVYRRVRKRLPTVSLDTVYRTLWLLKDLGLINTLGSQHERTRFDANLNHHHHFVCVDCRLMMDFYSEEFNHLKIPESIKSVGTIEALQVEVRGICSKCASKKMNRSKRKRRKNNE